MKPDAVASSEETEPEGGAVAAYRVQLRGRRRVLWRIGVGTTLVFLLVLGVVTYTDSPPPEVADLTRRDAWPAPDPEGYFERMGKLADSLPEYGIVPQHEPQDLPEGDCERMPNGLFRGPYVNFRDFLAAGKGWTPTRLALWDVALARLVDDCMELMRIEGGLVAYGMGDAPWKTAFMGEQLMAAAGMYRKSGDTEKAIEVLMLTHRVGTRITNSRAGLVSYRLGLDLQSASIRNLSRLVIEDEAAAPLAAMAWGTQKQPDAPDVLAEALRVEYLVFSTEIDELDADGAIYAAPGDLLKWVAKTRVLYPLVMKPNLTKGLYADFLRRQAEWCDLTAADYMARGGYELLRLEPRDLFRPVNIYGRIVAWRAGLSVSGVYSRRVEYRSAVSAFEAVLGLRLYQADHGTLPETLDALVPRYLPTVPVDYHDGAPIRYSRVSAGVWSAARGAKRYSLDFAKPPASAAAPTP